MKCSGGLPVDDGGWAGAVAPYSIIHVPVEARSAAWTELARVIRPGGWLLVAFHIETADRPPGSTGHVAEWWGDLRSACEKSARAASVWLPPRSATSSSTLACQRSVHGSSQSGHHHRRAQRGNSGDWRVRQTARSSPLFVSKAR